MNSAGESTPSSHPPERTTSSSTTTFSLALGTSKPKAPPRSSRTLARLNGSGSSTPGSSNGGTKRPHSSLHASDDEEDDEGDISAQAQLVSGFDHAAGGAIEIEGLSSGKKQQPLVIAKLKNRNWREESIRRRRGQRGLIPGTEPQWNGGEMKEEGDTTNGNGTVQSYGLTFVGNKDERMDIDATSGVNGHEDAATAAPAEDEQQPPPAQPKTEDELALEALLRSEPGRTSNLVLPISNNNTTNTDTYRPGLPPTGTPQISEDESFRADVLSRPDSASLEDYAAIPVEEFGAALLRGMGWKEGDVVGKRKEAATKPRVVERRPALLGIGAKELPGGVGGEELGAWGKAAGMMRKKGYKKRDVEKVYNPVVLRNKETGEMLTEEELKMKMEESTKGGKKEDEKDDWRERRDRNLRKDRERKEKEMDGRGSGRERYVLFQLHFYHFPLRDREW